MASIEDPNTQPAPERIADRIERFHLPSRRIVVECDLPPDIRIGTNDEQIVCLFRGGVNLTKKQGHMSLHVSCAREDRWTGQVDIRYPPIVELVFDDDPASDVIATIRKTKPRWHPEWIDTSNNSPKDVPPTDDTK